MRFKLIEALLLEDIASVRARFPKIDENTFNTLIRLDPTFTEGKDSVGTYGKWLLTLFQNGNLPTDKFSEATELLTKFDELKRYMDNKDIGQYKTLDALQDALSNVVVNKSTNRAEKDAKKSVKKNGFEHKDVQYIGRYDGYDLYIPTSYEGDVVLATLPNGNKTRWCTAGGDGRNNGEEMFKRYLAQGGFYLVVINPNDLYERYQFHLNSDQFMDAKDKPINVGKFLSEHPTLFDKYKELLIQNRTTQTALTMLDSFVRNFAKFKTEEDYVYYMVGSFNSEHRGSPIEDFEIIDNYINGAIAMFRVDEWGEDTLILPNKNSIEALNSENIDLEVESIMDDPELAISYFDVNYISEILRQDERTSISKLVNHYKDKLIQQFATTAPNSSVIVPFFSHFGGNAVQIFTKFFKHFGIDETTYFDDLRDERTWIVSDICEKCQKENPQKYANLFFEMLKDAMIDEFSQEDNSVFNAIMFLVPFLQTQYGRKYSDRDVFLDMYCDTDILDQNKMFAQIKEQADFDYFGQYIIDYEDKMTKLVLAHYEEP